jgi:hypothetical protein
MERIAPALLYSVMCDDVRREDNGKFLLIGLFEAIGAKAFPITHPTFYIVNCWCSGLGTFKQKTRIINKEGALIAEDAQTTFSLDSLKAKYKVIARFNNLQLEKPDDYAVEIMLDGDLKVRYPLLVERVER